ncbi:SCO family protein [uncultured Abyssibacter sp.]|uniref:SCO family protein n=1 Tax=uncultured Abyssibacter sp. TaxID=2320202 RepID=UPI0032B169F5
MSKRLLLLIVVAPAALGLLVAMILRAPTPVQSITLLDHPRPLPQTTLTTGEETTIVANAAGDQWRLMFFGFTHCPDICPTTLERLARVRGESELLRDRLRLEFVTVDPERDTPQTMQQYATYFDPDIRSLTGSTEAITELAEGAGIAFLRVPLDGGGYTMDHSAALVLVNPAGAIAGYILPPWTVDVLRRDLETVVSS